MELTLDYTNNLEFSNSFSEILNDDMFIINGGALPALIIFGITISPLLWVPAAIAGVCLLIAGIYVGFRSTYAELSKKYN